MHALHAHLDSEDGRRSGWLRGLTDARIAAVLAAIHTQPEKAWSLDDLARVAAMSRATWAFRQACTAGV